MATPSHVDLSVLWVPIMPETSKLGPEMEKAGKDATESFQKGSSDLPEKVQESFKKAAEKAPEVFDKAGADAGKAAAESFDRETKKKIPDSAKEAGEKAGDEIADGVIKKSSRLNDYATKLGDQLGTNIGAKAGEALRNIPGMEGFADTLQKIGDKGQDLGDKFKDATGYIGQAKDILGKLDKESGGIIGALGGIAAAAGEAAGALAAAGAAVGGIIELAKSDVVQNNTIGRFLLGDWSSGDKNSFVGPHSILDELGHLFGFDPSGRDHKPTPPQTPSGDLLPRDMRLGGAGGDKPTEGHLGGVGGDSGFDSLFGGGGGLGGAGAGGGDLPSALPAPEPSVSDGGSSGGSSSRTPKASYSPGSIGGASSRSDLHAQGGRVANLFAVAQSLVGTPYSQQLRNDCSGMVSRLATAALGMSPSVQFSTVNEGDWLMSHGFQPGLGGPNDLNIGWYDHGGGNAGHTAATLPGGINAESGGSVGAFALGGSVGAGSSQFEQHAHLAMDGSGPGGKGPVGSKSDPLYTAMADSGSGSSGNPQQDMAQQMGQGFLDGIMQGVGLDGSVFKGFGGASNPLDFGATKMATGLLNWGMGMAQQKGGGIPGMGGQHGAVPVGPGGAQSVNTGDTHIYNAPVNSGLSVTQNGVQGPGMEELQHGLNGPLASGRSPGLVPNSGFQPS